MDPGHLCYWVFCCMACVFLGEQHVSWPMSMELRPFRLASSSRLPVLVSNIWHSCRRQPSAMALELSAALFISAC